MMTRVRLVFFTVLAPITFVLAFTSSDGMVRVIAGMTFGAGAVVLAVSEMVTALRHRQVALPADREPEK
jgi:hypothetical protein